MDETPRRLPADGLVPASRYRSRAFAHLEWERVWTRVWLLGGHAARLESPGDFLTFEIGPESVLVTRGEDGRARAFFNVCQHRGNILCLAESGHAAAFQCAYHHWRYGLDGSLASPTAVGLHGFSGGAAEDVRLSELRCEERLGFVWVSMNESPEPIDAFLAPIASEIATYRPEAFTPISETTVEVACNWKTSVDVNNEAYHLATLHPELRGLVDDGAIREELRGPHSTIGIPLKLTEPVVKRQFHVFPNVQLNFTATRLEVYRHRPLGDDPRATLFDDQSYELLAPGAPRRPRSFRRIKHGEGSLGAVMGADVDLLPLLTRGMASRGFAGLRLGPRETCIAHLHRVLDGYLFGEADDPC
jgi:phenylpropionate dioxygenase-like ring-hydroxylating dioxygenase large terminal subunit